MLLSIDRVLQLVTEGKTLDKIAELAECDSADVVNLIEEARELLSKYDKTVSKRKVVLKKKKNINTDNNTAADQNYIKEILSGAELNAIPVNTPLTMNIAGISSGNPGHAGIGIIIYDQRDRQVGKVSEYIGRRTVSSAEHVALIRALKLAGYFQASEIRIRTDSENLFRQMNTDYKTKDTEIKKFLSGIEPLISDIKKFKIELIAKNLNDKAVFLAAKMSEKIQVKNK